MAKWICHDRRYPFQIPAIDIRQCQCETSQMASAVLAGQLSRHGRGHAHDGASVRKRSRRRSAGGCVVL
jgi:hypothetical protein